MSETRLDPRFVGLKRYGQGKCHITAMGDPRFHETVKEAFDRSLRVSVTLDLMAFAATMKARGVPDEAAREFLGSAELDDDVYLREKTPS
jgi:hypothetical protein